MSGLAVVLAPEQLNGVRAVLQDWSAVGLVRPFAWSDGVTSEWIADGVARPTALHEAVSTVRAGDVILTVLAHSDPTVPAVVGTRVRRAEEEISDSLGHDRRLVRCRVTAARKGDRESVSTVATAGWINVVLSPEDGTGPHGGRRILDTSSSADERDVHTAAGLAGALGLWAQAPLAGVGADGSAQSASAVVVRSYVRLLDAARAEHTLREAVLSTRAGMPLPRVAGGAEYVEDVALATGTMSEAFWRVNAGVLRSGRERHVPAAAQRVGPLEALRMFFGFLVAAFRNAPRAWLSGTIRRARAMVADSVQNFVFGGSDAAYTVVVSGVLPDGRPASWSEVGDALDALSVGDGSGRHLPHEDLTALWTSYAAAALTLCDAGSRFPELPAVEIGTRKGVLRSPDDVVPGPAAVFADVPPVLRTQVPLSPAPFDTIAVAELEGQLTALAAQPGAGVAASTALDGLRRWRSRHASGFATRLGARLGDELGAVRAELQELLGKLQDAERDDVDERLVRAQRSLARVLRIVGIVFLVLLVAVGVLAGFAVLSLVAALSVGAGLVVAWLGASLVIFFRGQTALFRLLARRRELAGQREVDERNVRHALRDARRLVDAYAQFQRWSQILGAVLAEPFGRAPEASAQSVTRVTGLPASVLVGEAVVDAPAVEVVSAELRRLVFEPGWLNGPWLRLVRDAHRRLGGRGVEFRDAPELLFRQLGDGEHTVLPELAGNVVAHGVGTESGDELWASTVRSLDDNRDMASRLVQRIRVPHGEVSSVEFFEGIGDPATATTGVIDDSVLRPEIALTAETTAVSTGEPFSTSTGLSRFVLLRQRTRGIAEYEFAFHGSGVGHRPEEDDGPRDPDPFPTGPVVL